MQLHRSTKGMQAYKPAVVIASEFHAELIANLKWSEVFQLCKTEQEHKMVEGLGGRGGAEDDYAYNCYFFHFITRNYSNYSKAHRI